MPFEAGRIKTGGRQAGAPNKITRTVKSLLEDAFEGMGGLPAFIEWGRENPTEFYRLWGRMLPIGIKLPSDHQENSEDAEAASQHFRAILDELARAKSTGSGITPELRSLCFTGSD